jgi:predicted dehydrogenase
MRTKLRIGAVGLGAVAQAVHLPLIQRRWDLFELVAVADLSASQSAHVGRQFGVSPEHRYETLSDMLNAEALDGVLLLTSGSHGSSALECIQRGVAVFCEKPLAFSLREIDALSDAERKAGTPLLFLAYMKEYDPAVSRLKRRLPNPSEIRYVNVEVLHPSGVSQLAYANLRAPVDDIDPATLDRLKEVDHAVTTTALGKSTPQAFRNIYSHVILGSLIHDISLVRYLFGSITGIDDVRAWAGGEDPGSIEISGTVSDQARIHMHWHYLPNYPRYRETLTIHHTTGSLALEFTVPYLLNEPTELRIVSSDGLGESNEIVRDVTEAFEEELIAFHAMVVDSVPPSTGSAEGRADVITGQCIARVLALRQGIILGGESAQ